MSYVDTVNSRPPDDAFLWHMKETCGDLISVTRRRAPDSDHSATGPAEQRDVPMVGRLPPHYRFAPGSLNLVAIPHAFKCLAKISTSFAQIIPPSLKLPCRALTRVSWRRLT